MLFQATLFVPKPNPFACRAKPWRRPTQLFKACPRESWELALGEPPEAIFFVLFVSFSELRERVVDKKENNVSIPGVAWD